MHSTFKAEVQLWPFVRMRNSKLGKQPMLRRGPFATTSCTKRILSCTTVLMKWLSDVQRNSFVSNNSRMSMDRPKRANRHLFKKVEIYLPAKFR